MKKAIFPFCFLIMIGVGLLSMNSFPSKIVFSEVFNDEGKSVSVYDMKYSDCITEADFSQFLSLNLEEPFKGDSSFSKEMNRFLKEYKGSLHATVKNLSAIDAHDFLHNEYERCRSKVWKNPKSEIQMYYNMSIMKICYEMDKSLNMDSNKKLVQLQ